MIGGGERFPYEERMKQLELLNLERRKIKEDMTQIYKMMAQ